MSEKRRRIIKALRDQEFPREPDPNRRNLKSRAAILDATLELVLVKGWHGLTIEGIAAKAGVGKQTIYRWWPSKGAVVFDAILGESADAPPIPDTGDFGQDLRTVLRGTVEEFSEPSFDGLMRALLIEVQGDDKLAAELQERLTTPLSKATVARIDSAREAGQVDPAVDSAALAELIYGPVLRRWLLGTGELDFEFADAVASMAVRAAAPD